MSASGFHDESKTKFSLTAVDAPVEFGREADNPRTSSCIKPIVHAKSPKLRLRRSANFPEEGEQLLCDPALFLPRFFRRRAIALGLGLRYARKIGLGLLFQ